MFPSMRTLLSKSFSRLTDRNNVDLPQPDGPTRAVTLLREMAIEMPCSACLTPYHRLKLSTVSTGSSFETAAWVSVGTVFPSATAVSRLEPEAGRADWAGCGRLPTSAIVGG